MSGFTVRFRLLGLLLLSGACMAVALAEETVNRITDIAVDASGQLILTVEGEGVDPMVQLEPAPNQQYRIVIQGQGALLSPTLLKETANLSARIHRQIPAVEQAQLSTNDQDAKQFQLVLTSWQKLQPQIKSNTGSRIVISLVGDHTLPPAIIAQQKIVAQQKRDAELKQQAILKRQAEAAAALKAEEQRRLQQQAEAAAALKAEEKRKLQQQAELAALKRRQEALARKREAEQQRLAAEKQKQKLKAEKLAAEKRQVEIQKVQAQAASSKKPLVTVSSEQLQSDWTTAYRPPSQSLSNEPLAQLQFAQYAQDFSKPFTPQALAQDKIPLMQPGAPGVDPTEPTDPIRLNAPPVHVLQDQGNFDWTFGQTPSVPSQPQPGSDSLYAVMSNPNTNTAVRQAWQSVQSGNATSAEMGLRNYLEKTPEDQAARYLLGQILLRPATEAKAGASTADVQARREAARQEFLKILSGKPYLSAYLALMDLYLDDENFQEANRLWARVLALYPENAMVLYQKGRLQEGLNAPAAAKEAYLQALGKDSNLLEAHFRLAQVELAGGRLDAARWELVQALIMAPSDGRLWKLLGFVAEKQNEPQKAGQFYRQALHPDALINYARSLEAQNQPDKAMTIYQAVETLAGDDIDILYNLGLIYANLKQAKQAEIVLGRFLELNQDPQDSRIGQAKATLKQLGGKKNSKTGLQPKILPF